MERKLNKKGVFDTSKELILLFPRLFIIILVFIVLTFLINEALRKNTDVSEIESFTIKQRLLYSKNCITHIEGERSIPGIIDTEKFQETNIKKCLENTPFGLKLTLKYENETKTVNINEDIIRQNIFCFDKNQVYCENKDYYILIYDNNKIKNGILRTELIRLKRSSL